MWSGFFFNTVGTYSPNSKGIPKRNHENYEKALNLLADHLRLTFNVSFEMVKDLAEDIREKFCKLRPKEREQEALKFSHIDTNDELVNLLTTSCYKFNSSRSPDSSFDLIGDISSRESPGISDESR